MTGPWKVGELAKATGMTVRALHHYDELGLLEPSGRTESGHRLYTKSDAERLQHIVALRHLGFSLEQIAGSLLDAAVSPLSTIAAVRADLERKRAEIDELDERLAIAERRLVDGGGVSTEHLLRLIEGMIMFEKYLTKDQLRQIKAKASALDPDRVRDARERDWPALIAAIKAEEDRGTDPADPRAQILARRWTALTEEVTGSDPATAAAIRNMYEHDSEAFAKEKVSDKAAAADLARCVRYIEKAMKAGEARG
jgi:DNA-binding transcriptional MerR regulator